MTLNFSAVKDKKNLLAFSAGVDSSALFFLLLEQNIPFDIAIVDYNVRNQSKDEVTYAKQLAKKYNKKVFIKEVELENSNFEKKARDIRYSFFEDLIKQFDYGTLITAHQLNDKLEWFMMQMSKGAGIVELLGFKQWEDKITYKIYKPLLEITKEELENYLKSNNHKYFIDNSNFDEKYKRNYFRHNYSDKFLSEFKDGIKNSFEYLENDLNSLQIEEKAILQIEDLEIFKASNDDNINIRTIDINLKKRGVLLSKASRNEILRQKEIVISHKISVCIGNDLIYIAPFSKSKMDKKFKEKCRLNKIPKNVRVYLYDKNIDPKDLVV